MKTTSPSMKDRSQLSILMEERRNLRQERSDAIFSLVQSQKSELHRVAHGYDLKESALQSQINRENQKGIGKRIKKYK